jgi:hypothetical protein
LGRRGSPLSCGKGIFALLSLVPHNAGAQCCLCSQSSFRPRETNVWRSRLEEEKCRWLMGALAVKGERKPNRAPLIAYPLVLVGKLLFPSEPVCPAKHSLAGVSSLLLPRAPSPLLPPKAPSRPDSGRSLVPCPQGRGSA